MKQSSALSDTSSGGIQVRAHVRTRVAWRSVLVALAIAAVIFLALYHLTGYPTTWFDEGSHLHVPKTLLHYGVYADRSSEGFRYYGPTVGVGPTVMLPIAGTFALLGIGLLQARLIIVIYSLATIYVFFRLARHLGGSRLAWVATALMITSRGVSFFPYGRQVLGEVPGLFFLTAGLWLWFTAWDRRSSDRLILAGLLLGLAMVTKYQYLLILAPTLGLAWLANLLYYRRLPQRVLLVPSVVAGACFAGWQAYTVLYLGPQTAGQNLAALREATAGAAMVFSPVLMKRGLTQLLSADVYLCLLVPVLAYGLITSLPRRTETQQWSVLFVLVAFNFAWYVLASISWLRYAFPGLAFASLFVARFFFDLTDGFKINLEGLADALRRRRLVDHRQALTWIMLGWLGVMILLPLAQTARQIIKPPPNAPVAMASYLDQHVSRSALIETWEPEMGFLTDHNYHFPPPALLTKAITYQWLGGPAPALSYDFVQSRLPDYVLIGPMAAAVPLYHTDLLATDYELVTSSGVYQLYERVDQR